MQRKNSVLYMGILGLLCLWAQIALAQVETPRILSAKFDQDGKLLVRTSFSAIEGCYVAVNGGLSAAKVETGITSIQLTNAQAVKGAANIKTKRKYYCSKRKLYVNVELVCLNSIIGSALSATVAVNVPSANQRR